MSPHRWWRGAPAVARVAFVVLATTGALLLASCPNPLPAELVSQINDTNGPVITVTAPEDGAQYGTVIQVAGTVSDDAGDASHISRTSYAVLGTAIQDFFAVGADGSFSFHIATRDSDGTQLASGILTVELIAEDWSGNVSTASIQLVPIPEGDIVGFAATPENGLVTLEWPDVPAAQSYRLFETKYGLSRDDVESPYVWDDLTNGDVYGFQLTAEIPDETGDDATSSVLEVMPHSARTFAPWVRETGYKSITIEWWDSPFVSEYTVERSPSADGPWEVHRNISNNVYLDNRVDHETEYYYRVTPAGFGCGPSGAIHATPGRFGREVLTYVDTADDAADVVVDGSYAYVSDVWGGFSIVDVSDPANPAIVSNVDMEVSVQSDVHQSYAYVCGYGLTVVDVSDPRNPGEPDNLPLDSFAFEVQIHGSHAFVADGSAGLAVVDISAPTNPGTPIYCPVTGTAMGIDVVGGYAYVAYSDFDTNEGGLAIVDVSEPTLPVVVAYRPTSGRSYRVTVSGSYAYLTGSKLIYESDYEGVAIIDVSNPLDPSPPDPVYRLPGTILGEVIIVGTTAYIAGDKDGFAVADLTDPLNPDSLTWTATTGLAHSVDVSGDYAFVTDNSSGLAIIDLAHPLAPEAHVSSPAAEGAYGIAATGSCAYLADWDSGLAIFDVMDPMNPGVPIYRTVESTAAVGPVHQVAIADGYAFLAADWLGLGVIDISDSVNPMQLATLRIPSEARDIAINGSRAYLAGGDSGLVIIDISDPSAPTDAVFQLTTGSARGVAVEYPWAYVADGPGGLAVIDVSDPSNPGEPRYFAGWPAGSWAFGIAVKEGYAYVASGGDGLIVVDISDPLHPVMHPDIPTSPFQPYAPDGWPEDVITSGPYAFIASNNSGIGIIDISQPETLSTPVYYSVGADVRNVTVVDRYAYVADHIGLTVVELWRKQE